MSAVATLERATALHFIIHGHPVPKQRPRYDAIRGRTYTADKTRSYEAFARTQATLAVMQKRGTWQPHPHDRYRVTITLFFANARGDIDNCAKAVLDAMNKSVWHDDRAVDELHVWRRIDKEHPRVEVTVGILNLEAA